MGNDATVTLANVLTKNGVVHIIDKVLMPPAAGPKSIVETALDTDSLSTLAGALQMAQFKPVLDALLAATPADPLTVFAPSNDALAAAITAGLDLAQVELVTATLQYHVIAGKISSTDLAEGLQFPATISSSASYVNICVEVPRGCWHCCIQHRFECRCHHHLGGLRYHCGPQQRCEDQRRYCDAC